MSLSPFAKPLSPNQIKSLGASLLIFSIMLMVLGHFIDSIMGNLAWFFAVPLGLLGLSLLFGNASKRKGLFSAGTLYFLAVVLLLGSLLAVFNGVFKAWSGLAFGFVIFGLARQRDRSRKSSN
ncbi:hypothetical protein PVT67_05325 [Gallaecimonas kandeliae]|uniref:hypothetical protein n=1 Tax=Gallaecimonas kandeliae TaxID=3029055 RepID=UPI00264751AA|nr:hypothetical protein [Gallaecimonas kandeliae]WKE66667.1 hypothetical protein PVT67_05325 [Gallaecimonas kandeliae]